jgi:tetratricopeptide (TPR) repeat protein
MKAAASKDAGARFCTACGESLAAGARFCAGCGQAVGSAPAPARSLRDQLPGLVVLTFFLVAGLAVWVGVLQPEASTSSAPGRGRPVAGGGAPGTAGGGAPGAVGGGDMPTDHPPVALPDEAKKFVTQLAEKAAAAPQDVAAWKSLAQVQARAAEMEPSYGAQALESWQHVLTLAPDDGEAIRGIGNVYYDQRKYDAAAEQYERYLKTHPDDASVRTDLATAYLYQRQIDKAVATYLEAIAARPEFLQAHFNLGLAYEAKGDRESALASLDKARALATDDETRTRIDRVKTQLAATPVGAAAAGITGAGNPPAAGGAPGAPAAGSAPGAPPHGPATAGNAPPPTGADFPSQVEAQLRAHQILGPKIRGIEWPEAGRARVLVADFPMQSMPEFARNLFHTRLETIIQDAKAKFTVTDPRTIEVVDAANDTVMESVTK